MLQVDSLRSQLKQMLDGAFGPERNKMSIYKEGNVLQNISLMLQFAGSGNDTNKRLYQLPITNFCALRRHAPPPGYATKTISENHLDISCGKSKCYSPIVFVAKRKCYRKLAWKLSYSSGMWITDDKVRIVFIKNLQLIYRIKCQRRNYKTELLLLGRQ